LVLSQGRGDLENDEGMMGPEQKRLMDRLFNDPTRKLVNFKLTPGDDPCTAEELCAEINKTMDERESGRLQPTGPVRSKQTPVNVREWIDAEAERLHKSINWK
jgi:hypothetical protein